MRSFNLIVVTALFCASCIDTGKNITPAEDVEMGQGDMPPSGQCSSAQDCAPRLNAQGSCVNNACSYMCDSGFATPGGEAVIGAGGCSCEVKVEVCNGEDDDCDGVKDNVETSALQECGGQLGVCAGARKLCDPSNPLEAVCGVADYQAHSALYVEDEEWLCDGEDNDCSGRADEGCCDLSVMPVAAEVTLSDVNLPQPSAIEVLASLYSAANDDLLALWAREDKFYATFWAPPDGAPSASVASLSLPEPVSRGGALEAAPGSYQVFAKGSQRIWTASFDRATSAFGGLETFFDGTTSSSGGGRTFETIWSLAIARHEQRSLVAWSEVYAGTGTQKQLVVKYCLLSAQRAGECEAEPEELALIQAADAAVYGSNLLAVSTASKLVLLLHLPDRALEIVTLDPASGQRATQLTPVAGLDNLAALQSATWLEGEQVGLTLERGNMLHTSALDVAAGAATPPFNQSLGSTPASLFYTASGEAGLLYTAGDGATSVMAKPLDPRSLEPLAAAGPFKLSTLPLVPGDVQRSVLGAPVARGAAALYSLCEGINRRCRVFQLQLNDQGHPICEP